MQHGKWKIKAKTCSGESGNPQGSDWPNVCGNSNCKPLTCGNEERLFICCQLSAQTRRFVHKVFHCVPAVFPVFSTFSTIFALFSGER